MYRLFVSTAVLALLAPGAARTQESVAPRAPDAAAPITVPAPQAEALPISAPRLEALPPATPVKNVEIEEVVGRTVCESVKLPGSRIVVRKVCYTRNPYDKAQARQLAERDEITKTRIAELRRDQEYMERRQRDLELARERAIAHQLMQ
jgi:hypothetical protein